MGSGTDLLWNRYGSLFGTFYAKASLTNWHYFKIVGVLVFPGTMNLNLDLDIIQYVLADCAKDNWR